jgi:hypothetical protein
MNKLILILPLSLFIYLAGCSEPVKITPRYIKNDQQLKDLVIKAAKGDHEINDSLSLLIDPAFPVTGGYNQIITKEISISGGNNYYYVLMEHPNPVYNRAAVYDSALNLYFLTKDLNGSLGIEQLSLSGFEFLMLKESFLTKDVININRIHLIKLDTSKVYPILDLYTGIKTPKLEYRQIIEELNSGRIKTKITEQGKKTTSYKGDVFVYMPAQKRFVSETNYFKQIIFDIAGNYKGKIELAQITDPISALRSAGAGIPADSMSGTPGLGEGFSLTFKDDWKKISDLIITDYLNQNMKGTKFVNTQLGAEISIVPIPVKDSSEMYVRFALPQTTEGNYKVRFSQKIEFGRDYLQLFEYSCGRNKFLMIFKTSRSSYYRNREIYEEIINSFTMDC